MIILYLKPIHIIFKFVNKSINKHVKSKHSLTQYKIYIYRLCRTKIDAKICIILPKTPCCFIWNREFKNSLEAWFPRITVFLGKSIFKSQLIIIFLNTFKHFTYINRIKIVLESQCDFIVYVTARVQEYFAYLTFNFGGFGCGPASYLLILRILTPTGN